MEQDSASDIYRAKDELCSSQSDISKGKERVFLQQIRRHSQMWRFSKFFNSQMQNRTNRNVYRVFLAHYKFSVVHL